MPPKRLLLASTLFIVLITFPLICSVGASSEMWSQTYGGASYEIATSLVETADGGYAIAGGTTSFGAGDYDFWLVKTDAYGNLEWNQTYGGANYDRAYSLVESAYGGYALAGNTGALGPVSNFLLVRTNEYGIPEFPSWFILPLLIAGTLVVIIYKQRFSKTSSNCFGGCKPRLTVSEACHRLALSEGQKKNRWEREKPFPQKWR